jgi:hypothetical protein
MSTSSLETKQLMQQQHIPNRPSSSSEQRNVSDITQINNTNANGMVAVPAPVRVPVPVLGVGVGVLMRTNQSQMAHAAMIAAAGDDAPLTHDHAHDHYLDEAADEAYQHVSSDAAASSTSMAISMMGVTLSSTGLVLPSLESFGNTTNDLTPPTNDTNDDL